MSPNTLDSPLVPKGLSAVNYEIDDGDALPRALVGPWANDKHALLERYVDISGRGVRKTWLLKPRTAGATYIDLFSGPGKARLRDGTTIVDGSPLVAWRKSKSGGSAFTAMHVADANPHLAEAVGQRLRAAGAPVEIEVGPAIETVQRVVQKLNVHALHFAFLDPYSLGALNFNFIRSLARLPRMDILIHVSVQDFNRNLRAFASREESPLDAFAPGWRGEVDLGRPDRHVRARIFEHWRGLLLSLGMATTETAELVTGSRNQPLYWLAFAARHPRALEFWNKIRALRPNRQAPLL